MSTPATSPLTRLDTEAFRRKLAGLADPDRTPGATEKAEVRETASRLCSILAHLFGESLERTTLWDRIGTALAKACAETSDDDLDRFVTICLEAILADPAKAAACEPLGQLLGTFAVRPHEWRMDLINYINTHRYAVLVHGRARWEQVKTKEVEL